MEAPGHVPSVPSPKSGTDPGSSCIGASVPCSTSISITVSLSSEELRPAALSRPASFCRIIVW